MTNSPPGATAQQIADDLRTQVASGAILQGERLPATRTLAKRYGVATNTITKAVRILLAAGLVTSKHGSGVYVRKTYQVRVLGPDRYARNHWQHTTVQATTGKPGGASVTQQGGQTQDVDTVPADEETAAALGIAVGTPVYERARVMSRDGISTHTMNSYYRVEDVQGTPLVDARPGIAGRKGGFQVLTDQGFPPDEITEDIFARMPTTEEALTLDIPPGEAVVEVRRTTRTAQGYAVEYARGVHIASRFAWRFTYKIPD